MPRPSPPATDDPDAHDDGPSALEYAAQARHERGAARLLAAATDGMIELVRAAHARAGRLTPDGLIPGLAYRTLRGVPRLVDASVDTLLSALAPLLLPRPGAESPGLPLPDREAIVAALNGVLGDHLAKTAHPLAIRMAFRHAGQALPLTGDALGWALDGAGEKLLVLIHDLCMNDLQWRRETGDAARPTHDHGAALAQALGFTPVYLHYDSGLHVSTNGRALAAQLERLLHAWPRPLARFAIVAHGMGGLLARSALHYGRAARQHWADRLDDLACLGTPHHGAPAAAAGRGLELLLAGTPHAGAFAALAALRAPGITDLGHGNLLDEDWSGGNRLDRATDRRKLVPLPAGTRCHALAASAGAAAADDGIVAPASALGRHRLPRRTLKFLPGHQRSVAATDHLQLLSSPEVFEQLRRWLER
jgi:hypothetical protein